jgi:hypothetical protein
MTTLDEIRAALDAWEWANSVGTTDEYLKTKAMIAAESPDWLRFLLAELDRLRTIEEAARVAADMTVIPVGERTFGKVSVRVMGIRKVLRDALAAFDATKGDSAT